MAYRAIGWAIGTRITTDWILDGETVDSAFKDIRNSEGENHLVSAGVGRGFRGGDWSVVIRAAEAVLRAERFRVDTRQPALAWIQFAAALDEDSRPIDPTHTFGAGTTTVFAVFRAFNLPSDAELKVLWVHNGALVERIEIDWPGGGSSGEGSFRTLVVVAPQPGEVLLPGDHRFIVQLDGTEQLNDVFKVE